MLIERPEQKPVVIFRSNFKAVEVNGINIDTHKYTLNIASSEHITPEPEYKNYLIVKYNKDHPGKHASAQEISHWYDNFGKTKHTEVYRLYGLSDNGDAKLISDTNFVLIPDDVIVSNQAEIDSFHQKRGIFLDFSPIAFSYLAKMDFIRKANLNSKVVRELLDVVRNFQPYHSAVAWALGCVCAVGAFFHNKNRTQNKFALAGWMAFALLFNVAGLLTCLALTHYDLIKCDNCGRKRHLLTESCLHCGKQAPAPLPQTTDITGENLSDIHRGVGSALDFTIYFKKT